MSTPIRDYLRQQHLALLALVLVIGGGTAVAASVPRDSVTSKSVKNNALKTNDLKDGKAVGGIDVADNSLTGADVANNSISGGDVVDDSVTGADVANNSISGTDVVDNSLSGSDIAGLTGADIGELTGADIAESTLSQVPSALTSTVGGIGRYNAGTVVCDPESATFVACTTASITLPTPARLLVLGRVAAGIEPTADRATGSCRIGTTVGPIGESETNIALHDDGEAFSLGTENVPLLAITEVLASGTYGVGVDCNQGNSGAIWYFNPDVAVLAISAG
jgi:hypothetical protein